jgi:hypothetical protein
MFSKSDHVLGIITSWVAAARTAKVRLRAQKNNWAAAIRRN